MVDKQTLINELSSAFSLTGEAAETACLLLEARARTLDYTLDEYLERYHPGGIAEKDENLPEKWKGYVQFLGDDAAAVLRAGKGADFGTFIHECAHVFRRQLSGGLREQAEKAFGVENGEWGTDREELFARGLERWIKQRYKRDRTRGEIYNKGKDFVGTVYRGMEYVVEIDPGMEAVYERLFEDNPYKFRQNEYEETLHKVAEGELPKTPHVFLGMTPRIYEELGFERLPVTITSKHIYSTLRASGKLEGFNYHDLGEDILKQLPEQLKKPLLIVQSAADETEIISIIGLKDKNDDTVIVPVSQYCKGNFNGAEIDVNLVKSIYGRQGFEQWLKAAIDDNRLLYIDKKKTEPALTGKLPHSIQGRATLPPELKPPDVLQNLSGFYINNITRYKEEVKRKFPERFRPTRNNKLYNRNATYTGQLSFNFDAAAEESPKQSIAVEEKEVAPAEKPEITIPLPNNPENFLSNFVRVAPGFNDDTIEAARYLLRAMSKDDRETTLREMREQGNCESPLDFHRYLGAALREKTHGAEYEIDLDDESLGLTALQQSIEQRRKARNERLSAFAKEILLNMEKEVTDLDLARGWLISAKEGLRNAKQITLSEINEAIKYNEEHRLVSFDLHNNVVSLLDFPPGGWKPGAQDIKEMMVYNAEAIVKAIQQKIVTFENVINPGLFSEPEQKNKNEKSEITETAKPEYKPYGAWTDFENRLSVKERERINSETIAILEKSKTGETSEEEKNVLRRYSGFGGIAAEGEHGVLYDYYTSPPVARLTWELLEKSGGITDGGKILEPSCGTGVFFEYTPAGKNLSFTGVELDERTANVAELLHSGENREILHQSFEAFNLSDQRGGFDHVVGNAPFGERGANLMSVDKPQEKSLDNYFVSRSLDNLREGGTMALIAAPGVLENKQNKNFRLEVSKKARFLGAVKLPERSFHHTHTQVTPVILLFKKYPLDIEQRLFNLDEETFKTTPLYDENFISGDYFENHPEHIAGVLSRGTGQWGGDEIKGDISPETIKNTCSSFVPGAPVPEAVYETLRETYFLPETQEKNQTLRLNAEELQNLEKKTLREGEIKIHEKNVYLLSDKHEWEFVSGDEALAQKIEKITNVTEAVHKIRECMLGERPGEIIRAAREAAIVLLTEYEKQYGTFPGEDKDVKRFTREHPGVQGIYEALLPVDAPLLTEENVYRKNIEIKDGHNAAVSALLYLREKMKDGTEETINEFFPDNATMLLEEIRKHNDIFITPEGTFQLREDFISGDAWDKIDGLQTAALSQEKEWKKEKMLYGAKELEKAVGWTAIEDADFSPRSSWIPLEVVREWAVSDEALGQKQLSSLSKNEEGKWGVTAGGIWEEKADPLIYYLNEQKQRSRYYDTEAYNKEHDELFRSFISNHEEYREKLEREYNRKFKTHITAPVKTYPVEIAGWRNRGKDGSGKTLKPHQWQTIHHLYRQGRGISALGTGFGKTAAACGLMSLLRQEGKSKRVFLQVPNNKVKDWVHEIQDVMPHLKVASIDPEEAGYTNRDKRYAKYQAMAASDADIIIMPESSGSEIQLKAENDRNVTERVALRYRMEKEGGTAREKEKAALKGEKKADSGKKNLTISFEDFGCDAIVVDEAHRYKNLFSSNLSRETGLNDGRQSAKAMSLYKKSEYIREQNNGKNVFLLTATPLTNSPLEYYNMTQYIAPEELKRMGVGTIDAFIREFAHIETGWIYDWGNGQAKEGRILTGFKNLETLQNLFFAYTDLQNNPEAIGLEKPRAENIPHVIQADEQQMEVLKSISRELDEYKSLDKEKRRIKYPGENFLTFYSKMRTASLDLELYDPEKYKTCENPKLEKMTQNAYASYKETKGGQVIFCDRVFSSDATFNIHEKIKESLIKAGFKEKEIVIVNGFTKGGGNKSDGAIEKEVSKAISDYNEGKYKVIIGSTACIGEGVNLQKNSSAVHHFDIPYRPSDFIQRNGRVDRQGNAQNKVTLNTYLAKGTIDNYSVSLVQRKAGWIDRLLRTRSDVFTNPDDENSINADELLLTLTEEWGDKEAARERREKLEKEKAEKIEAARRALMKTQLKNLSLARGSLEQLDATGGKDKKGEKEKRVAQVKSLEMSLKNNPLFKRKDVIEIEEKGEKGEKRESFLYHAKDDRILRKGDVLVKGHGSYIVEKLNHKKQELICKELLTEEEKRVKEGAARARRYPGNVDSLFLRSFKLSELDFGDEKKSYNSVLYHLEKPGAETVKAVTLAPSKKFYTLSAGEKERCYDMHVKLSKERYGYFNPVLFEVKDNGALLVGTAKYGNLPSGEGINPFSPYGGDSIKTALSKGVVFKKSERDSIIETLGETIPELKGPVESAFLRAENMGIKGNEEKKENLGKSHVKSRVHIA